MRPLRIVQVLAVASLCGWFCAPPTIAEDTEGKWQFGFGISYYSTTDFIRSNADNALASSVIGETGLPGVGFVDPRPDDNVLNEPSVRDDFRLDVSASYGLTRWLAIELAASYLQSPVGEIETYTNDVTRPIGNGLPDLASAPLCGPTGSSRCSRYSTQTATFERESQGFLPVGDLTEMPIQLSALVRFRPESPFDPFIGLGLGYIFTDMTVSDELKAKSDEITGLLVQNASEGEYVDSARVDKTALFPGFSPGPITVEVNDAFEWHMVGGVDYYMNEKFSVYVDARYIWTTGSVDVRIDSAHEVLFPSNQLGKLRTFQALLDGVNDTDTNGDGVPDVDMYNLWEDQGIDLNAGFHSRCPGCQGDALYATEDKFSSSGGFNQNGTYDCALSGGNQYNCSDDDGILFFLPPGTSDLGERVDPDGTFCADRGLQPDPSGNGCYCPTCYHNGPGPAWVGQSGIFLARDTEDTNYNRMLDRFLSYGRDICTGPDALDDPVCTGGEPATTQYVWPEGCSQNAPGLQSPLAEGCPPPRQSANQRSDQDNVVDTHLIQGGEIRLGGFSLGVGVKFTF